MSKAVDIFVSNLENKSNKFKGSLKKYVSLLGHPNHEVRKQGLSELSKDLDALAEYIGDVPQKPRWIPVLQGCINFYAGNGYNDAHIAQLMEAIATNYNQMMGQRWDSILEDDQGIDIADTFLAEYKAQSVEADFDRLIEQLEAIINNDGIDSNRAIQSLKSLISLIRKNKGNAFSAKAIMIPVWNFCVHYLDGLERHENASPYLKEVMPALRKTVQDLEDKTTRVFGESGRAINAALTTSVKVIEHKQSLRIESTVSTQVSPAAEADITEGEIADTNSVTDSGSATNI